MVPPNPQPFSILKQKWNQAVSEPFTVEGPREPPGNDPKHVFDFEDGMRLVISVDKVIDKRFLHVSAYGNERYQHFIEEEGFEGLVEDVLIRIAGFMGRKPAPNIHAHLSKNVLHMIFEDEDDRGFTTGNGTKGSH